MKRTLLLLVALLAAPLAAEEITVLAAASLTDALTEIGDQYRRATGVEVFFSFAASSTLARQIQEGAPADLFVSADEEKMDGLAKRGLIANETRVSILSNTLVIVVNRDRDLAITSARGLTSPAVRSIALGEPQSVPVGLYAKAYLAANGVWEAVAPKVIPASNARAALAAVESGNADAAIVYRTDALASREVRIAHEIPPDNGPRISYPFAVLRESRNPRAARRFLSFLNTARAREVFARHGFLLPRD